MDQSVNLSTSKCLPTADLFLHGSNSADHSKNNTDTQQYAIQWTMAHLFNEIYATKKKKSSTTMLVI